MKVTFREVSSNKKDNINSFQSPFGFTPNKKKNKNKSICVIHNNESSLKKNESKPIIMSSKNISSPIKRNYTSNGKCEKINSKKKKNEIKVNLILYNFFHYLILG